MNMLTNWPYILFIVLIVVCVVGYIRLFCPVDININWRHVSSIDENGKWTGKGEWKRIPTPDEDKKL